MREWADVGVGVLLTAEYERLKEEQTQRIGTRDNLIYATMASIAAVAIGTYETGRPDLLLLLAPGCLVLGWTYLVNDEKISAIGRYLRTGLSPRLAAVAGTAEPVFGWESAHRADRHRRSRKVIQLCVDLLIFCVPGMIAVIVRLALPGISILIAAILVVEITLVLILGQQIVVYADLRRDRSWSVADADVPSVTDEAER